MSFPRNETRLLLLPNSISSAIEESPRYHSRLGKIASDLKELRRLEFELGRSLAQQALTKAGWMNENGLNLSPAIGKNDDRSPIWPKGFVGSISHSDHWVWVAVAQAQEFVSIGIDTEVIVEPNRARELRTSISHDKEWECMSGAGFTVDIAFTVLFSAKEAFFKLCYPLTKIFWEFQDLEVVKVRLNSLADQQPKGTIFLRCRKPEFDPSKPKSETDFILRSHIDTTCNAHPVGFQIIGQDVFTFAKCAALQARSAGE